MVAPCGGKVGKTDKPEAIDVPAADGAGESQSRVVIGKETRSDGAVVGRVTTGDADLLECDFDEA